MVTFSRPLAFVEKIQLSLGRRFGWLAQRELLSELNVLDRVIHAMLHTSRNNTCVLRLRHSVRTRSESFHSLFDAGTGAMYTRVVELNAILHQLPRNVDIICIHESMHDDGYCADSEPQNGPYSACATKETHGPAKEGPEQPRFSKHCAQALDEKQWRFEHDVSELSDDEIANTMIVLTKIIKQKEVV